MPANISIPKKPSIRIVLRRIFECYVHVKRLSSAEIAQATQKHGNKQNYANILSSQLDHNYSLASLVIQCQFFKKFNRFKRKITFLGISTYYIEWNIKAGNTDIRKSLVDINKFIGECFYFIQ